MLEKPEMVAHVSEVFPDADRETVAGLVEAEIKRKRESQRDWPHPTDIEHLMTAFDVLADNGVIAIHDAGWDQRDAIDRCLDAYERVDDQTAYFAYCYYTTQDIDSAIDTNRLYIGFGSTSADRADLDSPRAARLIVDTLKRHGLKAQWNGDLTNRVDVKLRWLNRT